MSEPAKTPFDLLLESFRQIVREEIGKAADSKTDHLLAPEEAAKLLCVSEDWLYHQAKKLPFTRKLGPRLLRFSERELLKWIESKKFRGI